MKKSRIIGYEVNCDGTIYTGYKQQWCYNLSNKNHDRLELTKIVEIYDDNTGYTVKYYNSAIENNYKVNFKKLLKNKMYRGKKVYTENTDIHHNHNIDYFEY